MSTLIFDIETVGESWETLDAVTQAGLSRWIKATIHDPAARTAALADMQAGLGFSPFTGYIVAIGLYDLERTQGVVYYTGHGHESDETIRDFTYRQRSEAEMLEEFWDGARHYQTFVTYNGRGFDVPFPIHRSLAHQIRPTRPLLEGRYPYQQKTCRHVDLQDELTFYGALRRSPSLHLLCRTYGIESPKQTVSGDDVAELYAAGQFRDIAHYNARDVIATTALYQHWQTYLAPPSEDQIIDL